MRTESRRRMSRALRLGPVVALIAAGTVAGSCDPLDSSFFGIISVAGSGDIVGDVTVDGVSRAGAVVILTRDGTTVDTFVSDDEGRYAFLNLEPDEYSVSTTVPGATCPEVDVTVEEDEVTETDLACTTPTNGTVQGQVTVNGAGEPGVPVALLQGITILATTTTDLEGRYQFSNATTGTRVVEIDPPTGVLCDIVRRNVTVTAGGTATADFACTRSGSDFSVTLNIPPPGWVHDQPGVSSLECKVIHTSPAQPGATFSAQTSGPLEGGPSGVLTAQPVTGVLNVNGEAPLQVRIDRNRLGTYLNVVTVTSGAFQRTASATVTVTAADNTCPVVQSSIRFKRGVVALLPDDVRPLGLRPVSFRYVEPWGDPAEPRIGLIAEEVFEVFPGAVFLDAEGRPQAIEYRTLTRELIEEIGARALGAIEAATARLASAL